MVAYANSRNILIEVRYREDARINDDDAIAELSDDGSAAIIVTRNNFGVQITGSGKKMPSDGMLVKRPILT